MGQSRKSFTTEDEIEYIHGLGTWSEWAVNCKVTHSELIQRYIENNPLRSDWGEVNPGRVMEVAEKELY